MQSLEVIAWIKERISDNIQSMTVEQIGEAASLLDDVENQLEELTKCIGDDA